MRFDILTIFPNFFDSFLQESLLAKARKKGIVDIRVHNLRKWTTDKHHTVDDKPYGGGPGMILKFAPIANALQALGARHQALATKPKSYNLKPKTPIIMLDPAGKQFTQAMAEKWAKLDRLVLLCGRYEGFDHRVTRLVDERISIGPYVLNGGEAPAMVLIEAVARLVPGFVGKPESLVEETFGVRVKARPTFRLDSTHKVSPRPLKEGGGQSCLPVGRGEGGEHYVEYPQYTRPETVEWRAKRLRVPKILLSGDHARIAEWRKRHRGKIK